LIRKPTRQNFMRKLPFILLVLFYLCPTKLSAQDRVRFFEITSPKYKVQNSLYRTIGFLDSREDSSLIGVVNIGLLKNQEAKLILRSPVLPQLTKLVDSLTDSSAREGEVLFHLKDFYFSETMGSRYCYLNAGLYAKEGSQYKKISFLDTVIIIKVSDVTKALLSEGNKIIADFIAKGLLQQPADTPSYGIADVKNMNNIEKEQIPAYTTDKYTDGIYTSYLSFKSQTPDKQGLVEIKRDGSISSVKIVDTDGKKSKVKSKNLYAVISGGKPFIATEYGYYPLERINNIFLFTGDVRVAASTGDMRAAQFGFGLIGAALESSGNQETYELIIDHLNGRFVHLRPVKKPAE
jgi:hypothetical protein